MHMADALLAPAVAATMYVASGTAAGISIHKLKKDDEVLQEVAIGSGPLDASFKAINRMLGVDVQLADFSLNAVTAGEDSIGEAVVKISDGQDRSFTGTGISTDIIEASWIALADSIEYQLIE